MREVDEEIREIKKEIIESRGLVIKTNNLVNSLAADIKSIARRQAGYERRFQWNGAVAYVLFAALSFVGLKLASDARIGEIEAGRRAAERRASELERELSEETRRGEERARAEVEAQRFYAMIRERKRREVVERYPRIAEMKLSPAEAAFFRDTVDQFRMDLAIASYQQGLDLMRTGRHAEAAERFQQALRFRDQGPHVPLVQLELARALRALGRYGEAIVRARRVLSEDTARDLHDDALWVVARASEELKDLDAARDAYRQMLRRFPRSSYAPDARTRLKAVLKRIRQGRGAR